MKNIKAIISIIVKLKYILNREQKLEIMKSFVWSMIATVLELLGVSAIYPFIQILITPDAIKDASYISWIYRLFPDIEDLKVIMVIGAMFIVIYVVKNALMIYASFVQGTVAAKIQKEIANDLIKAYLRRPYEYFININSSEIVTIINSDVAAVYSILTVLVQMISDMLTIVALATYLVMIDAITAFVAMGLILICFLVITLGFKKKIKIAGKEVRQANKQLNQITYQMINGIKDIIVTDRKDEFVKQFNKQSQIKERSYVIESFVSACPDRILEGVCIAGFMAIVCVRLYLGADIDSFVPVVGSFAMGAFKILPSVAKVSNRISTIIYRMPSLDKCHASFSQVKEDNLLYGNGAYNDSEINDDGKFRLKEKITVESISWQYKKSDKIILNDLNLTINKGQSIAFIGASGAGKSTLADIVLGLLKPQKGAVFMDGIDIASIPHSWAKTIGYVPQSVFLLDDTIRANVAFGLSGEDLSDECVWHALEQAQLKTFVEQLPQGLDTILGERGIKFSGGQRQRIAIARALYVDPEVLILDEATSALDNETELAVMEAIEALQGHKTIIIVAHRLSTIEKCDCIYEITDGKAVVRSKEEIFGK